MNAEPPNTEKARVWARWRDALRERRTADLVYRIVVGVVGLAVLGVGILAIPYPGPGWAIVFIGLGILATEFAWARHTLAYVRERYHRVMDWYGRQGLWIQILGAALTFVVVIATLWLVGGLALMARLVGFDRPWLSSPLF